MKSILKVIFIIVFCMSGFASYCQVPQGIPYEAVARNSGGQPLINQAISIRFTIHRGSPTGLGAYSETQSITTNDFGLFTAIIGAGVATTAPFATFDWAEPGAVFLQIEMDITGGSTYINMGNERLMSVPFALYAAGAVTEIQNIGGPVGTLPGGSANYVFTNSTTAITLNKAKKVTGVATAMLGLSAGTPAQYIDYGLCYQLVGNPTIYNFAATIYTTAQVTTTLHPYAASYSISLSAGTYYIGFGIRNGGPAALNNNDYVNGWIMITDP